MPSKLRSRSHQENVRINSYCKTLAFAVGASRKYQNWCVERVCHPCDLRDIAWPS
jgi:hypothetical protein